MKKTMYLTKYALTEGIKEIEAEVFTRKNIKGDIEYLAKIRGRIFYEYLIIGKDIFYTFPSAQGKALEMRDAKIKKLEEQINKLKQLKF